MTCFAQSDGIQCGLLHQSPQDAAKCPARTLLESPTRTYRAVYLQPESPEAPLGSMTRLYDDQSCNHPTEYTTGGHVRLVLADDTQRDWRRNTPLTRLRHQRYQAQRQQRDGRLIEQEALNEQFGGDVAMTEPTRRTEPASYTAVLLDPREYNTTPLATVKAQRFANLWRRMDAAFFFAARDAYDKTLREHPDVDPRSIQSWMAPGMARCFYSAERADRTRGTRKPLRLMGHIHSQRWEERDVDDKQRFNFRVSPEIQIGLYNNGQVYMHLVRNRKDPNNPSLGIALACPQSRFELGRWMLQRRHRLPPYFRLTDAFTEARIRQLIESSTVDGSSSDTPMLYTFRRPTEPFAWLGFYKGPPSPYHLQQRAGVREERIRRAREWRERDEASFPPPGPIPEAADHEQAQPMDMADFRDVVLSTLDYSKREEDAHRLLQLSQQIDSAYLAAKHATELDVVCGRMRFDWTLIEKRLVLIDYAFNPQRHPAIDPSVAGSKYNAYRNPMFPDMPNGFYLNK